ncbi:MAG TPA: DUF4173 domain-containing protein [Aldersonia sp.]
MTTTVAQAQAPTGPIGPRPPRLGEPGGSLWPHRVWPALPVAGAPGRVLLATVAAGAIGAVAWQISSVSIGYLITAMGVFAAAYLAQWRVPTRREAVYLVATFALLAVPALRAAPWLAVLCVMAAWVTGWLALAGGRTWTALALGSVVAWFLTTRVAAWTGRGVRRAGRLDTGGMHTTARVLRVGLVTAALVLVFGALFAGADRAFANLVDTLIPAIEVPDVPGRAVTFVVAAALAAGAAYLLRFPPRFDAVAPRPGRSVRRWEWVVPLAALDAVFVAFVVVQLAVLFGGSRHVLETEGLTYAEYARQGFWQLLVVSALALVVLAFAVRTACYESVTDRVVVRTLLGLLCAMSVVVVVSAVHRMWVYEQAYGFTAMRLFVMTVELWLGSIFALVSIAGVRLRPAARWLPQAVLATGVVALLCLAALDPDRFVAERNIDRYHETGRIDLGYLGSLSTDAVPALDRLPEPMRSCALARVANHTGEADAWNEFNLARTQARDVLAGVDSNARCVS